jgi:uncharacterized protein (UPF0261 family)
MATIAVLGTLDTKGEEHAFVADQIRQRGHQVLVIDVGALEPPRLKPDVTREEVAQAAGVNLADLVARRDRGETVKAMSEGAPLLLSRLVAEQRVDGVISWGGGGGTGRPAGDALLVWDVSDLTAPEVIGTFFSSASSGTCITTS